jgi:hypothetical protein
MQAGINPPSQPGNLMNVGGAFKSERFTIPSFATRFTANAGSKRTRNANRLLHALDSASSIS